MEQKVNKELYSQFLLATFGKHSALWLARLLDNQPAHDSFTRWLSKTKLQPHIIWEYVQGLIKKDTGYLIIDDSVLDKWYSYDIELVQRQYSGTHHRIVKGIGVVNLVWTDQKEPEDAEHIVLDFRIYSKKYDGKTKNDHAQDMLRLAKVRNLSPQAVLMDSWYSSVETLRLIRSFQWTFIAAVKANRQVSVEPKEYTSVAKIATTKGISCHLKEFGAVNVFKLIQTNGDIEYLATNDVSLTAPDIRAAAARRWKIEEYHRGVKQITGIDRCQARNQRAQRNHIFCSALALVALEKWRLQKHVSWYEAKQQLIVAAIAQYLKQPFIPITTAAV